MAATVKDVQNLIHGVPGRALYHLKYLCLSGTQAKIQILRADPLDFQAQDMIVCTGCDHEMSLHWFLDDKWASWVEENYTTQCVDTCECGSAKALGIKPFQAGHSWWCPVYTK